MKDRVRFGRLSLILSGVFFLLASLTAEANNNQLDVTDLTDLSIEELMNVEVTSVSKHAEKLSRTAAAVYVITAEDIRRSGMSSIPELLRMVPGIEVARITSGRWAVTSRGFNGSLANKLLVMIDGRSVYTPFFAGVYWDSQDLALEDIERIEVVRGPGATMWGANAVNGVINIITKNASETQETYVSERIGTEEKCLQEARFGGMIGENGHYRVYGKSFDRANYPAPDGGEAHDAWDQCRGGFRADWKTSEKDSFSVHGDAYSGSVQQTMNRVSLSPPYNSPLDEEIFISGVSVLISWERTVSDTRSTSLQLYYDRTARTDSWITDEMVDTFDIEYQSNCVVNEHHDVMWGVGYRRIRDDSAISETLAFDPSGRTMQLFSTFIQDRMNLSKDILSLTVGTKIEHNDFTGLEVQPNLRLVWTPGPKRTVWASVSRAIRTPSRVERDLTGIIAVIPDTPPIAVRFTGIDDCVSEELTAYELGYRFMPTERLSLDAAAFYNVYRNLMILLSDEPVFSEDPVPHLELPTAFINGMCGRAYGAEIAANWDVNDRWKLALGYSWLQMRLNTSPPYVDSNDVPEDGKSPHNKLSIRSYLDMSNGFEFDTALYYVDSLPSMAIPSYIRMDVRLGWEANENLYVNVGVQNLLDSVHQEFGTASSELVAPAAVPRTIYGQVTWRK